MRFEFLDKIANFLGHSPHDLLRIGVLRTAPSVGGQNSKRNFLRPLNDMRISKEKKSSGTSLPSQSYGDCTSTNSDHRIRGFIRVMLTRMFIPRAALCYFFFSFSLQKEGGGGLSVSKSG